MTSRKYIPLLPIYVGDLIGDEYYGARADRNPAFAKSADRSVLYLDDVRGSYDPVTIITW
jgi:hypothetical protein